MCPDQYDTANHYKIEQVKWEIQCSYPGAQILGEFSNILLVHVPLNKIRPKEYPLYNKMSTMLLLEFNGSVIHSYVQPHVLVEGDLRLRTGYFGSFVPSWLYPISVSEDIESRLPGVTWSQFIYTADHWPVLSQSPSKKILDHIRNMEDELENLRFSANPMKRIEITRERQQRRIDELRAFDRMEHERLRMERRLREPRGL